MPRLCRDSAGRRPHRVAARQTGVPPPYWGLCFFRARGLRLRRPLHPFRGVAGGPSLRGESPRHPGRGPRGARHRHLCRPSARGASPPLNGASRSSGERASPAKSALRRHKSRSIHHLWRYILLHKNALSRSVVAPWSLGPASYRCPVAPRGRPISLCSTAARGCESLNPCRTAAPGCGGRGAGPGPAPRVLAAPKGRHGIAQGQRSDALGTGVPPTSLSPERAS